MPEGRARLKGEEEWREQRDCLQERETEWKREGSERQIAGETDAERGSPRGREKGIRGERGALSQAHRL